MNIEALAVGSPVFVFCHQWWPGMIVRIVKRTPHRGAMYREALIEYQCDAGTRRVWRRLWELIPAAGAPPDHTRSRANAQAYAASFWALT